ncbi:trk system potassium uptake protein TrkH [Peptoclostridium litorale DSM 5388]|uniref:Ktr system potassium uptake protein B n=1 Tax=Peptoclostridium litorale DSM 5388 TaxID=1121324 RepID=A0A069RFH0_PEPLI|nr:TrkH family potassium uptake protein [Peptoclostridium litorale]KDR95533.1 Ktr system potassium uptake protein B [Peptoclostridium litorale DSM 5388]SIN97677.1 trk system potassium uptake protein TrkH [Peptoclostridium litorale DSM 5388]
MIRSREKKERSLSPAQIIVVGFAVTILIGALLLNLPAASKDGQSVGFINALFTSTSAVCVTGLVVVDTGTYWTDFGKIVILCLIQIGGVGFMSMATMFSMLIGKRISLRERMIIQEALNQNDLSGLVRLTRHILIGTFLIEAIGAILLSIVFIPEKGFVKGVAYGVFHSVSAFCNAGFDIVGNGRSLTPYVDNIIVNFTVMGLIILGGIGFTVIIDILKKGSIKRLSLHSKMVISMTTGLIVTGFALFFALEFNNPATLGTLSIKGKVLGALFQSVTPRTAGFNTIDMDSMRDSSKFLTIVFMFIGGSPGSTAGGIKTSTLAVLILTVLTLVKGKEHVEAFKRRISYSVVNKALAVVGIGISLVIFMTMALTLTESFEFLKIFFETVSAFGTVGLSLGMTSSLSMTGKILISILMFSGRVGALTVLLALAGREKKTLTKYPEGRVIVG